MKRVFAWVAALAMLISSSFNVMASNEVSVSDGDLTTESATTKDVEVDVEKGSTFTVSVPIIPPINEETYQAIEKTDGFFSDCLVTGDIASNEQIVVSVDEDVVLSPDGGLKDSVTWKAHTIPSASTGEDLNSTNIENGKTKTIGVKLSKYMPAGLWRGYLHVNVAVDTYGSVLTAEQFKALIGTYDGEVNISIPKYVEIDGVQTIVRGIGEGALSGYPNLATINLETDEEFYFEDSFKGLSTSVDTVVINGNSNIVKVSGVTQLTTKITFSNCTLYVDGNPYVDSVSDMIDMSTAQYVRDVHGSFTELSLNERSLFIDTDCMANASIDKLVIPEFVFNCVKSAAFRGSGVKEVEVSNKVVGDSWFEDCKDLTKVTLEDGVTTIGDNAFSGCTNLTDVEVPETVTAIGTGAFDGTPFLDEIKNNGDGTINGIPVTEVKTKSELIYSEDGTTLIKIPTDFEGVAEIKEGVITIADGAIENNSYDKVTLVKIPSTVTSIGDSSYYNLGTNFMVPGRIELDEGNASFVLLSKMTFYTSDGQIGLSPIEGVSVLYRCSTSADDCGVQSGEAYKNSGVVSWYSGDSKLCMVQPIYMAAGTYDFTFNAVQGTATLLASDNHGNIKSVKITDVNTESWSEATEMSLVNKTYRIEVPKGNAFMLFTLSNVADGIEQFNKVCSTVQISPVYSDEYTELLSVPEYYDGVINVPDTCSKISDSAMSSDGDYRYVQLVIPNSVVDVSDTVIGLINSKVKSVTLSPDNPNFVLIGNDTGYTLKQYLCKADKFGFMTGTGTLGDRYVVQYGVVRTQATSATTNTPVTFNPVWLEAGAYTIGAANMYARQYELVNTDANGKPISSFGNNGVLTVNWNEDVTIEQDSYLFITPIFTNKGNAYSVLDFPLSKSVALKKAPLYSTDKTQLLSVPADYDGALTLPDTCTIIADGTFNYYDWVDDNSVYGKLTKLTISKSVTTISDSELSHINAVFGENEKVQLQDGNTVFTVMSGTDGTNDDRQVVKASDSYKPVKKMSYEDCDGVVYAWTDYKTESDLCIKPVYLAEGSYTVTQTDSNISEFCFVATKSSGSKYVLDGASEDDDLLHSSNGTISLTVPSGGLFIWTNITSNGSNSSLASKTFKELFTIIKN